MPQVKHLFWSILLSILMLTAAHAKSANDVNAQQTRARNYQLLHQLTLISLQKIQSSEQPKIVVKSIYPQLKTSNSEFNVASFNQQVTALVEKEIQDFKQQATHTPSLPKSLSNENSLLINYDAFFIQAPHPMISIRLRFEGFIAGMAHGYHRHSVLNYDLTTGKEVLLDDLFKEKADYLAFFSDFSRKTLTKRLSDQQMLEDGTKATLANFKLWNLKANGLLITFDEYSVAPYVNGTQTVFIPYRELKPILAPQSPIMTCIKNNACKGWQRE